MRERIAREQREAYERQQAQVDPDEDKGTQIDEELQALKKEHEAALRDKLIESVKNDPGSNAAQDGASAVKVEVKPNVAEAQAYAQYLLSDGLKGVKPEYCDQLEIARVLTCPAHVVHMVPPEWLSRAMTIISGERIAIRRAKEIEARRAAKDRFGLKG